MRSNCSTYATVFLDFASTSRNDLELGDLAAVCEPLTLHEHTNLEQRLEHIGGAEIIISNKVLLDAPLLEQLANQIQLICVAATGTNNVDLDCARRFNLPVSNVRNYGAHSVAEHVLGLMLALARYIPAYHQAATQGAWSQSEQFCLLDYPITELAGKTFAVVGYGNLGQASAKLAAAIGMKLLIAERPDTKTIREGRVSFEQALAEADVLSLHCPLTPNTQYLMNAARLQQMKPSALLINTARGALVEPHDLILALQAGWIAGAALDVLSVEPPSADHILLQTRLPNLIITPHIAWASQTARQKLIQQLAQIIQAFQQGERINAIV